jgi:tubulin-specific chaperone E
MDVGRRVRVGAYYGTVKYVGNVAGTSGTWLGIDWDDVSRGKHDGKSYFSATSPSSGSFVRPGPAICWGRSFIDAFRDKYQEPLHGSQSPETVVLGSSNGTVVVEAVNLDKVRRKLADFTRLRQISLDDALVEFAGPPGEISSTIPSTTLTTSYIST